MKQEGRGVTILDAFLQIVRPDELDMFDKARRAVFVDHIRSPGKPVRFGFRSAPVIWNGLEFIPERLITAKPIVRGVNVTTMIEQDIPLPLLRRVSEIDWDSSALKIGGRNDAPVEAHFIEIRVWFPQEIAKAERSGRTFPDQAAVNAWILDYYRQARTEGRPAPKRDGMTFPACRSAIGASDTQMRSAMQKVPADLKRGRGDRDIKSGDQIGEDKRRVPAAR